VAKANLRPRPRARTRRRLAERPSPRRPGSPRGTLGVCRPPRWTGACDGHRSRADLPALARVKAAQRLAKRAFRARDRRFLAEGPQAVREATPRPARCSSCSPPRTPRTGTRDPRGRRRRRAPVHLVNGEVMAALPRR
jgi:hypothetical protein